MKIAIGFDHAGFPLKATVITSVQDCGHEILDLGTFSSDPVDYPDYAEAVGRAVQAGKADRGILVCGSGIGACIAANKLHGIRAGLCFESYTARQSVEHDDANILVLGARVTGSAVAEEAIRAFLHASFLGEPRHARRVSKIMALESNP